MQVYVQRTLQSRDCIMAGPSSAEGVQKKAFRPLIDVFHALLSQGDVKVGSTKPPIPATGLNVHNSPALPMVVKSRDGDIESAPAQVEDQHRFSGTCAQLTVLVPDTSA